MTGEIRLPVLASEIRQAHAGLQSGGQSRWTIKAKELLEHGKWLPWLNARACTHKTFPPRRR
jgi:hypothetical protein